MPSLDPTKLLLISAIREGPSTRFWRAASATDGRRLTVKEVAEGVPEAKRPWVISRLRSEFDFLRKVDHPQILHPSDWDEASGRILLDDAQGSVAKLVDQVGALDFDRVARAMRQGLVALDYLHEQGWAHGSFCTHSLLIDPFGDVRLGDFTGYPRDLSRPPRLPEYDLKYCAPELIDSGLADPVDASLLTVRADLYALGYTALEMLAGTRFAALFWGGGGVHDEAGMVWLAWHADVRNEPPPLDTFLVGVPDPLLRILGRLIRKRPQDRVYRSAREVIEELDAASLPSDRALPRLSIKGVGPPPGDRSPTGRGRGPRPALELRRDPMVPHGIEFGAAQVALVGSDASCALRLRDEGVDPKHALLLCQRSGAWWVYDLASRKGVVVNGARVPCQRLRTGDQVRFGPVSFGVNLLGATRRGRRVGRFRLLRRLHRGLQGDLHLAEWVERQGLRVALREYPAKYSHDPRAVGSFLRGVTEAGKLRHPNLVRLYRGGRISHRGRYTWYLAMEYLPGGSLRDRFAASSAPMPPEQVVRFALDVCQALIYLEDSNLVHRNINPSCLLFDQDGTAKLGDFFLMRDRVDASVYRITQTSRLPRDFVYQPPELVRGERATAPSDMYALAACMYEALTGQQIFDAGSGMEATIRGILQSEPAPPARFNPQITPELSDLLASALDKDPRRRPASAREMLAALQGLGPG